MQLTLLIIFVSISIIKTFDYDINNQQICTHRPFMVNFPHNCSRTRLIQDVNIPNSDEILHINLIFSIPSNINTSLTIIKSPTYNQKVYFTFFTIIRRHIYINNQTIIILNNTAINLYLYDTLSEQFTLLMKPYSIPPSSLLGNPYCLLKNNTFLPSEKISRNYFLYTKETDLNIDLSRSSYHISPLFYYFDTCFDEEISFTPAAIVLIVIVSILTFVTTILIAICLRKQLIEWCHILKNRMKQKLGLIPRVIIDN